MSGSPVGEPLQGHSDWVRFVAFSSDGTRIASGSFDKTARIWDAMLGVPIGNALHNHFATVTPSPDTTRTIPPPPPNASAIRSLTICRGPGYGIPRFSDDSTLHDDGWVTTTDGPLLFWVPPEHHLGLFWPALVQL